MHVIKPLVLGIGSRAIEYRKRLGLAISGYLYAPFAQAQQGTLWSEQSMWNFLAQEMATPLIDEGVPKLTSEFLVHGRAYTRPERRDAVAVRAQVGSREKTLLVFGERGWAAGQPTAPQPFDSLPLTWDRAYGGPDFAANPQGRGRVVTDGVQWLPNIELPGDRSRHPQQPIAPAGFGALDVMHPQRAALRGTYDDTWQKEHAPGFPPDLDWRHFNLAPQDQWFDTPLAGDEPYAFHHLHPEQAVLSGRLPGLRVRSFVRYRREGAEAAAPSLREVPMRLTTAWFFPHAERMVLVFQGLAEVDEDDGSDVEQLLGAVERLGEARPPEHYLQVLHKRLHPRLAMIHALNDADLTPAGLDHHDPEAEASQALMRPAGLREDAQYRRAQIDVEMARDQVRARGQDPDALGLKLAPREKPPTLAELPGYLARISQQMEEQQWAAVEDAVTQAEQVVQAVRTMKQRGIVPADLVHRGPPTYRAREQLDEIERVFSRAGKPFDRSALAPKLAQQEWMHHHDYLRNAHLQPPAAALTGQAARTCRGEVEWLLGRGQKSWIGIDLTGADLSGLDLSGIDFSGAWLESANLQGADVTGAQFKAAVLAHADLRGARATGARFNGANLGRARLAAAVLDEADLSGAVLQHCDLAQTRLRGAKLDGALLLDTSWGPADWSGVHGSGLLFYKLDLQGWVAAGARLPSCQFVECNLSGVDFRQAQLDGSSFVSCRMPGVQFAAAALPGAVFVERTDLTQADFSGANLQGANLGGCELPGARFVQARLDQANLAGANLAGCDARLMKAPGAMLRKTVLRTAQLAGADLKDAILQHADLRSADLRSANLFGADLARARLDAGVRLEGANVQRARTWPRRPPEAAPGSPPGSPPTGARS